MSKKSQIAIMIDLDWSYRHHLDVFSGTQHYAAQQGRWEVRIDPHADDTLPARGKKSPYDGVIGRATRKLETRAKRLGVPVVNVWFNSPARNVPGVFADFAGAGRIAAEHLLLRGLRRFGYIGFARERATRPQFEAYAATIAVSGGQLTSHFIPRTYAQDAARWSTFHEQLSRWLDTWELPMGVLTSFDLLARYVANACTRRGWRVPEDVAIMGTADESQVCLHPAPSLSSIDLGYEQVGTRAARLLDEMLHGKAAPAGPIYVPPRGLVARRSTDMYAVDDPMVEAAMYFISDHCTRDINVDDVAAGVAVTRRTLERRFRLALGTSLNEELNRLRLERAKRRLMESDASIKAIAVECGFGSSTQMGLVFQRFEQITPSEYRLRHAPETRHQ